MIIDLKLPDIGSFDSVDVIDISVNIGDHVEVDDTLLTLESDKASMDVPAEKAGVVTEILVNVGDSVKEGDLFARLEIADTDLSSASAVKEKIVDSEASTSAEQEEKSALVDSSIIDADCDLVVIGGGPGGIQLLLELQILVLKLF